MRSNHPSQEVSAGADLPIERVQPGFIGRVRELGLVDGWLADLSCQLRVLFVDGAGGVGKSALLHELAQRARRAGWAVRRLERLPSITAGLAPSVEVERDGEAPLVVLVDDWNPAVAVDQFFGGPNPSSARLIVLASRRAAPIGPATLSTRARVERLSLVPFDAIEARCFVVARGVDAAVAAELATRFGGHPLVLALASELHLLRGELPRSLDQAPELVAALLRQLVDATDHPRAREALEALAIARSITESLLAVILARDDVSELFAWLAERSFVTAQPSGLVAHDLVREALAAELAWRAPERADVLKRRAMVLTLRRLRRGTTAEQFRAMGDLFFLFRAHPMIRMYAEWAALEHLSVDHAKQDDHSTILDAIHRHEGPAATALAREWLKRYPAGAFVVRRVGGLAVGFSLFLRLDRLTAADRGLDPVVDAALAHCEMLAVDRRQSVLLHRFWLGFDGYQEPGELFGVSIGLAAQQFVSTAGIALSIGVFADASRFAQVFGIFGFEPVTTVDLGGRAMTLVARDWREEPPLTWFASYAERLLGIDGETATIDDATPEHTDDWFAHTRDALRGLHEPQRIASSPLAQRLVGREGTLVDRAARLRSRIDEAVSALSGSRRGKRAMTALSATYLAPEGTQEEVAEALDLPFSTYRRHLNEGITLVADFLRNQR